MSTMTTTTLSSPTATSPSMKASSKSTIPPSVYTKSPYPSTLDPSTVHEKRAHDFSWSETDEPHATRRRLILAKYPQIEELFVKEPKTFFIVLGELIAQVAMAYALREADWWVIIVVAYCFGAVINHSLQLAAHELSHNLCWDSIVANKLTAIMCNFATGFPSAITFQRYHMDHHQYQGVDGVDTDIPTPWEAHYVTNLVAKVIWICLQPVAYSMRPIIVKPKPFIFWEAMNWTAQVIFDACIFYYFGAKSLSYLFMGTLLGIGLHPSAGHFIAEHYEFIKGQETYSYYGLWNYTNFNVGYHNEHHDFPRIPWSKLPDVKRIAPEFYDLPHYTSYLSVFWRFITDPEVGCWTRVKRKTTDSNLERLDRGTDKRSYAPYRIVCTFLMGCVFVFCIANILGADKLFANFMKSEL